jgi:hypothetical protein
VSPRSKCTTLLSPLEGAGAASGPRRGTWRPGPLPEASSCPLFRVCNGSRLRVVSAVAGGVSREVCPAGVDASRERECLPRSSDGVGERPAALSLLPLMVAVYYQRDLRTKGSAREQIEAVSHSRIRADQLKVERIMRKFERLQNLNHWPRPGPIAKGRPRIVGPGLGPDHCNRFIVSDL